MSAEDEAETLHCYPLQRHYGVRAWITFEESDDNLAADPERSNR